VIAAALAPARAPGVAWTLGLALLARIPIGALSLLIVLAVRHDGHSYAIAGAASGACAFGMAASAPVLGRLMDRLGQTPILLGSAGATAVTFGAFGSLPAGTGSGVVVGAALLCGLALPPVSASVRVVWQRMLDAPTFGQVVTLDASLQELAFMVGPLVLVTAATLAGPPAVLAVTGAGWAAITVAFALRPETRAVGGTARAASTSIVGPVRDRGVRTLLLVAVALGVCIGATELGVVTLADEHHARSYIGLLYGAWSLGSLVGGFLAMRRPMTDPVGRSEVLLLIVATATAVLALAPSPAVLGGLLLFAGVANAPLFGALYSVMADIAPPAMATEAFSLQSAGLTVGIALGTAAAGLVASGHGPTGTFLIGAGGMVAGAAAYRPVKGHLRRSAAAGSAAAER
jgi:MFS family permease